ncbi:DUF2946 family protein [Kozakia baliensis]|uniref:DUF2946 family protein n=1 Tax=Kozakia baliensis TaxID=153496 RepID=UPI0009DEDF01|nr:DUF2946 family protein [Kozakia baliensis]
MANTACFAPLGSSISRWLLVLLILLGFSGQLLIQNQAMPGEMPRATILRLTGIDIAQGQAIHQSCHHVANKPMQGMTHAMMACNRHKPSSSHHHHDGSCPLCPLLQLSINLLSSSFFISSVTVALIGLYRRPIQPRAPPVSWPIVAAPRGPPALCASPGLAGFSLI